MRVCINLSTFLTRFEEKKHFISYKYRLLWKGQCFKYFKEIENSRKI